LKHFGGTYAKARFRRNRLCDTSRCQSYPGQHRSRATAADYVVKADIADLEQASLWLEGDTDVFGAGEPIKGVASDVVTRLTENEEKEPPRGT
jgi:hypothetical protein